jgi:hypothetical protein
MSSRKMLIIILIISGSNLLSEQVFHYLENRSLHFAVEIVGLVFSTSTPKSTHISLS